MKILIQILIVAVTCAAAIIDLKAQSTAFTYQGQLTEAGSPANGSYDLTFSVWNDASSGAQIGAGLTNSPTTVSNGVVTATLDFGSSVFNGTDRWLEMGVRTNGGGAFIILSPRQKISSVPYAIQSANATTVPDAAITASKLSSGPGSNGQVLKNSLGQLAWAADNNSGGTVTSVATGTGLTGGPLTTSGTISINTTVVPRLGSPNTFTTAPQTIQTGAAGNPGLIVRGAASQTANLQEWQNSAGTAVATVSSNGAFTGSGAGLTSLSAANLSSGTVPEARLGGEIARTNQVWLSGGNASTVPGTSFLGTTDNQPLEVRVNNLRTLRLETRSRTFTNILSQVGTNHAANVLGGSYANVISNGIMGATIAGGGSDGAVGGSSLLSPNIVSDDFGSIGGGKNNIAGDQDSIVSDATAATVAGGADNIASAYASAVGGGVGNQILSGARWSTISGGENNNVSGTEHGFIGGGYGNFLTNATHSVIAGGGQNSISPGAGYSVVGGGFANAIQTGAAYATIPGGNNNAASGDYSFAAGFKAKAFHQGTFVWADTPSLSGAAFGSSGTNQFLIRASGGVGIGKTNPATALDVNGTVTATAFVGNGSALTGVTAGSGSTNYIQNQSASDQTAGFRINGNGIFNGGKVGIGTTTPSEKLQVREDASGAVTFPLKVSNEAAITAGTAAGVLFQADDGPDRGKGALVYERTDTWNRGRFHFLQETSANSTQPTLAHSVLTIANNGDVGIGNTNPTNKLHVGGSVKIVVGGTTILVNTDGSVSITSATNITFNTTGDLALGGRDVKISASRNLTVAGTNSAAINSSGTMNVHTTGALDLQGSTINLN